MLTSLKSSRSFGQVQYQEVREVYFVPWRGKRVFAEESSNYLGYINLDIELNFSQHQCYHLTEK